MAMGIEALLILCDDDDSDITLVANDAVDQIVLVFLFHLLNCDLID